MIEALAVIITILNALVFVAVLLAIARNMRARKLQHKINTVLRTLIAALHERVCDLEAILVSQGKDSK